MKFIISIVTAVFLISISYGQNIPIGKYVGYEQNPFCYSDTCIIKYDSTNHKLKSRLYFEVKLNVTDSGSTIEKIPVLISNGFISERNIDSAKGGYYYYKIVFKNNKYSLESLDNISGSLIRCKFCLPCGSATCRYNRIFYTSKKSGRNLLLSTSREFDILFTKQD